MDLLICVCWEL